MTKESQASKILKTLKASESGVTNVYLNKICFRYGARIHELRKEGHHIITERVKPGVYRFFLKEEL